MRARRIAAIAAAGGLLALAGWWWTRPDPAQILASIEEAPAPVLGPAEELATFRLAPGFRAELVAAEPLVVDPVAMDWDDEGRLYVAEMRGFMPNVDGDGEEARVGRVVVLEDVDGDGRMDRSDVFLDGLVLPRAVAVLPEGVLIAAPPDLLLCRDDDGDRACDAPIRLGEYAATGGNPEHQENGLLAGLDGWLYNAKSRRRLRFAGGALEVGTTVFRGQFGIAQDDDGRLFYNHNSGFLYGDTFPAEYTLRQPGTASLLAKAGLNVDLAPGAEVFGVRTAAGLNRAYLPGTLREDGRQRGPTAASGLAIQRGDQFGEAYVGDAFVPEASGSAVAHFSIRREGTTLGAEHALYPDSDFGQREFLASTDERFRPVDADFGPDGALWVIDMYRGVIQHAAFVSDHLRDYIARKELAPPGATGRIWRIVREDRPIAYSPPSLATLSEQIAALDHPNGWVRDRAQRRLIAEARPAALPRLRGLAAYGTRGQPHALRALAGLGELDAETWHAALASAVPGTRSLVLRLGESLAQGADPDVARRILEHVSDPDPGVRLQAILSLGALAPGQRPSSTLADIGRGSDDPVIRQAVLSSLAGEELGLLDAELARAGTARPDERALGWIAALGGATLRAAAETSSEAVARFLERVSDAPDNGVRAALLQGIEESQFQPGGRRLEVPARPRLFEAAASPGSSRVRPHFTWPGDPRPGGARPLDPGEERLRDRGRALFAQVCAACHGEHGQGGPGLAPGLVGSPRVRNSSDWLVAIILHGLAEPGSGWPSPMPGHGGDRRFDDDAVAGLATHLRRSWGHAESPVSPGEVRRIRASLATRSRPFDLAELLELPTRHRLETFTGTYRVGIPLVDIELVVRREIDHLTVGRSEGGTEPLEEIADGVFASPAMTLRFEADEAGGIRSAEGYREGQRFPLSKVEAP